MKSESVSTRVLQAMHEMQHEQVMFFSDNDLGLKGIIAIHNTALGPSLGGCRIWNYADESDALQDVLRLSRGMTFKSSLAGINLGGGKSVIISDPKVKKDEAYWRRFGQFVESLGGRYITAEDVGTSTREIAYIMQETKHCSGKPVESGGSGDPSPHTALGVFLGLKAAVRFAWGNDSLEGKRILVQGVGHVGRYLTEHLTRSGAKVFVSDINEAAVQSVANEFGATVIPPQAIYTADVDVYAPCALGATLNSETIPLLKAKVIAGAANNQLADEEIHGQQLIEKGIVYAPDFLINSGGVVNCYKEVSGISDKETTQIIEDIYNKTLHIVREAANRKVSAQRIAIEEAENRILATSGKNKG